MDSRELRIGNWIEKGGKQYQVTAIGIFCCGVNHNPIPLTEEWLLRFGFYKQVNDDEPPYYFTRQVTNITCTRFSGLYLERNEVKLLGKGLPIKYVHQLQNLYYALTGEELEYDK